MSNTHENNEVPQPADEVLVRRVVRGDTEAYGILVERYQQRIFNLIGRLVGRPEVAEDLAQEVFIRAYEKIGLFRFESSFYTWLYTIALNTSRNHFRKRVTGTVSIHEGEDGEPGYQLVSTEEAPEAHAIRRQRAQMVRQALDALPVDQREALVMCDLEGQSYQEIADLLDVPIGTVRSRIFRARNALKEMLPEDLGN